MVLAPFLSRSSLHARAVTGTVKRDDVMREPGKARRSWECPAPMQGRVGSSGFRVGKDFRERPRVTGGAYPQRGRRSSQILTLRLFPKLCGSYLGRQGKAFRSVQARRAAVTSGGPAPAPPIPQWGFSDPLRPGATARSGRASRGRPLRTPAGLARKVASSSPRRPRSCFLAQAEPGRKGRGGSLPSRDS